MPKFRKELPEKYYLDHFNEFMHFISLQCAHLLDIEHQEFLKCYQHLSHDSQCMFVRVINRKSRFIDLHKMIYEEINDCALQLNTLQKVGLLGEVGAYDFNDWLQQLTKIQLLEILEQHSITAVKKSAEKSVLLEQLRRSSTISQYLSSGLAKQCLVKNFESCLAYLLFLFFGDTSSGLDKFSMRDLGVLKTRSNHTQPSARFVAEDNFV